MTTESTAGIPRFLVLLTALGLALAVAGGVLLFWPASSEDAAEPSDNVTIVNQVNTFATEYNTYDSADLEDYQRRIVPLMTDEYAQTTIDATATVFEVLEPREQKSTDPKILKVAIESRDEDSARVMVVVDATVTNNELDGADLRQMRWILSLQKEGGDWKIDAFESVPAAPASTGEGTDDPAVPTPTDQPTEPEPAPSEGDQ